MKPRLFARLFHTTHLDFAALWLVQLCLLLGFGPAARAQVTGPGSALNLDGASGYAQVANGVWFNGTYQFQDPAASTFPRRFYRLSVH